MEKVFIGKTWKSNEFDDGIPSLCKLVFSDEAIRQLILAKSALNFLGRIGADEIHLSPLCDVEWRKFISEEEVELIKAGQILTNIDFDSLSNYIGENQDDEDSSDIKGEALEVGGYASCLSAYNKHSETIINVQCIPLHLIMETDDVAAFDQNMPVLPAFTYRMKEANV